MNRLIVDPCQIKLIVDTTDQNQPMRRELLQLVPDMLGSHMPVGQLVASTPGGSNITSSPDLIPEVHANNSGVLAVSFGELFKTVEVFILRIFLIVPQPISIIVATAPLRLAGVVIEDNHQSM